MDPQLLAQNPTVKKVGRIISIAIAIIFVIEVGLFILLSFVFGSGSFIHGMGYVFLIYLAQTVIGYSIKPTVLPGMPKQASGNGFLSAFENSTAARKFAGTLLMIPGFITDLGAVAILIPPLRRGILALGKKLVAKKMSKAMGGAFDPAMLDQMMNIAKNMKGSGMGNPCGFAGCPGGRCDLGGAGSSSQSDTAKDNPAPGSRRDRRRHRKPKETIVDVDYEIRDGDGVWVGGTAEQPTDLAVAMKHKHVPSQIDDDIIDVEADWSK